MPPRKPAGVIASGKPPATRGHSASLPVPLGSEPARWLRDIALAADLDRLRRDRRDGPSHPDSQVDRAWSRSRSRVTSGWLAGLDTDLRLGTLVSPIPSGAPGIIAKTVATLDALSGGRASAVLARAGGCVSTRPTDWTFRRCPSAWINCSAVSRRCEHSGHPAPRPTPDDMSTCRRRRATHVPPGRSPSSSAARASVGR